MKSKKLWIPALVIGLAVIVIIIFAFNSCGSSQSSSAGMVLDTYAVYYEPSAALTHTDNGIAIPGYGTIYFAEGETVVPLTLYNPKENDCLFKFEIYIDQSTEPIFTTDLIEPGKATEYAELKNGLTAGEYTLKIKVCTYTADDLSPLNNAVVSATLKVI